MSRRESYLSSIVDHNRSRSVRRSRSRSVTHLVERRGPAGSVTDETAVRGVPVIDETAVTVILLLHVTKTLLFL